VEFDFIVLKPPRPRNQAAFIRLHFAVMIRSMITCFDIGGTAIKCAIATADGKISDLHRVPTPTKDFAAFTETMRTLVEAGGTSRGIAISIAGVINPADGRIKCANIPCIDGRTLAADLSTAFDLPVWIINDADSFALAEAQAGAGRGYTTVFGLILGTGVGGGLVIGGRLISGPGGFAGEWGHGPVAAQYAGTPPQSIPRFRCGCGQTGCLDTVGSARGLERLHLALHQSPLDSREIIAAWQAGDAAAERTKRWLQHLAPMFSCCWRDRRWDYPVRRDSRPPSSPLRLMAYIQSALTTFLAQPSSLTTSVQSGPRSVKSSSASSLPRCSITNVCFSQL